MIIYSLESLARLSLYIKIGAILKGKTWLFQAPLLT